MRRRDFIALLGGATAWPVVARAQQGGRTRRIGVLMGIAERDPRARQYLNAFQVSLRALGWIDGQNARVDFRGASDLPGIRAQAEELADLTPEVVVTHTTPATSAIRRAAPGVPIIFIAVSDPVATGFVHSFPHPGGTITGFTNFEASIGSKWLALLRDVAPSIKRVAMLFNPGTANTGASGGIYLPSMQTGARALGIELIASPVHDPAGIDRVFASLTQFPDGGVSVMPNVFTAQHRERIIGLAAHHRIPTIYPLMHFVEAGGLMSYGIDYVDQFRRAASYADRILKGTKPSDLPVEQPTKFELVINLKTARALGLEVPDKLLALADEVIE